MARGGGTTAERLAAFLLEGVADDQLARELAGWMAGSSRFRAFVEEHHDKIRKKLRVAADSEMRRDVRAELRTAYLLLAARGVEVSFEPYGSATGGPDFDVRVGSARFNLEVTRLRGHADDAHLAAQLLAKLRQLPPSAPNAVLIAIGVASVDGIDLATIVRKIRRRADAKDEAYFLGRGFRRHAGLLPALPTAGRRVSRHRGRGRLVASRVVDERLRSHSAASTRRASGPVPPARRMRQIRRCLARASGS